MEPLRPPRTVYHGTDSHFDKFEINCCLGAHFGTREAAWSRLRGTGKLQITYEAYALDDEWFVRELNWSNRPPFEHGPFATEEAADTFMNLAPAEREPIPFEIDVYRPLELPDLGTWTFELVMGHLQSHHAKEMPEIEAAWSAWNRSSEAGWANLKLHLQSAGYDCIAYRNETEDPGSVSWIVMQPDRIHKAWRPSRTHEATTPYRERMRA